MKRNRISIAALRRRNAFTLIELSIGLTILSLIAAGALTVGGVMVEQQQYTGSNQRVVDAKKALANYFAVQGRLPCPASRTAAPDTAGFGVEVNCGAGGAAPAGTLRRNGGTNYANASPNMAGIVRYGVLPVRTLGLRDSAMFDDYGNRISYAMSEQFGTVQSFAAINGAITLVDGNTNAIASANTANAAVFVVYSHGPNGAGSYRGSTGSANSTACLAAAVDEAENCNDNGVFMDTRFNNGVNAGDAYFDDMVQWVPKYLLATGGNANTASPGSDKQVIFNNSGYLSGAANFYWDYTNNRVGIGTATPSNPLHLLTTDSRMAYFQSSNASYNELSLKGNGATIWSLGVTGTSPAGAVLGVPANAFALAQDGTSTRLTVTNAGNMGVGIADPGITRFSVSGTNATAGNGYVAKIDNASTDVTKSMGLMVTAQAVGINASVRGADTTSSAVTGTHPNGTAGYLGRPTVGVQGTGTSGYGVWGSSTSAIGVVGQSTSSYGVRGETANNASGGVQGANTATGSYAVLAAGANGINVNNGTGGHAINATATGANSHGVVATSAAGYAFYGNNSGNHTAYFSQTGGAGLYAVYASGSIYTTGSYAPSDRRLKEDIAPLKTLSALEIVERLQPVSYRWKENTEAARSNTGTQFGLIAQDVLDVVPSAVREIRAGETPKGEKPTLNQQLGRFYTVDYERFVPFLIGAAQELHAELQAVKQENETLKARMDRIETALKEKGVVWPQADTEAAQGTDYRALALLFGGMLAGFFLHALTRRK